MGAFFIYTLKKYVTIFCYKLSMGSALPYDDRHDNEKKLVDCDICGKRFLMYPDKVSTCTGCLNDPTTKKQRNRNQTPIAFLFE